MTLIPETLRGLEMALAISLVQSIWQDALLALAAALSLAAMARRPAAVRHTVGMLFLVAMLVAPLIRFVQLAGMPDAHQAAGMTIVDPDAAAAGIAPAPEASSLLHGLLPPAWLAAAWAAGVIIMLMRLAGGAWLLRSLRGCESAALPEALARRFEALRQSIGITRPVAVRVLHTIDLPFSAQAMRPVIWLPLSMLTRLAPEHLEALVAHELAHVRRLDWVWNGLQCGIESLLFFHPGVWWLSARVRQERECACDELAAAVTGNPIVVAEALASLEALRQRRPALALAANGGALLRRIERLLSAEHRLALRWSTVGMAAMMLGAGALLAVETRVAALPPMPTPAATASGPAPASSSPGTSDPWWTRIGNSMEIRDDRNGHSRDYHQWVDLKGERHETYRLDGQSIPIDDQVRNWVAEHHRPPAPPAPPVVPESPPPPRLADDPAFQAIAGQLQHNADAVQRLGTPIRLADDCGPCRIDDDSISLHLSASGPKGSARLQVQGRRIDGQWRLITVEL